MGIEPEGDALLEEGETTALRVMEGEATAIGVTAAAAVVEEEVTMIGTTGLAIAEVAGAREVTVMGAVEVAVQAAIVELRAGLVAETDLDARTEAEAAAFGAKRFFSLRLG